jgi:transposase
MGDTVRMSQTACPIVTADDRVRREAIVADRNRAQKHVARARIVLHSADRLTVAEIARLAGVGRPAVWRWQRRFVEAGVDDLLRDKTRKPGKVPIPDATVQRIVDLTRSEPPGEAMGDALDSASNDGISYGKVAMRALTLANSASMCFCLAFDIASSCSSSLLNASSSSFDRDVRSVSRSGRNPIFATSTQPIFLPYR